LLFILSFVPYWAAINYPTGTLPDENVGAWGGYPYFVKLGLLLALLNAIFVIVKGFGLNLILPAAPTIVYLVLAGADALFVLVYAVLGPPLGGEAEARIIGLHATRGILLFVGLVLALLQTYGGWLHLRSARTSAIPSGTA
jgi:hypothetical protein